MLDISSLKSAWKSLQVALNAEKNDFVRDAVVKRFEYTYELSWKMMQRYLKDYWQLEASSKKNLFREAAKHGLIDHIEDWFKYIEYRNLVSHTYNEERAETVYEIAPQFLEASATLIKKLEQKIEEEP